MMTSASSSVDASLELMRATLEEEEEEAGMEEDEEQESESRRVKRFSTLFLG